MDRSLMFRRGRVPAACGAFLALAALTSCGDGPVSRTSVATPTAVAGVLVAGLEEEGSNADLFLSGEDATLTRLTDYRGPDYSPAWSPDGSRIAWVSDRDDQGNMDIYVGDAQGTAAVRVTTAEAIDGGPAWTPSGDSLAFWRSFDDGRLRLLTVDLASGQETPLAVASDVRTTSVDYSPTGDLLAATRTMAGGRPQVVVADADTGQLLSEGPTVGGGKSPQWSPTGKQFLFIAGTRQVLSAQADGTVDEAPLWPATERGIVDSADWGDGAIVVQYRATNGTEDHADDDDPTVAVVDLATGSITELTTPSGIRLLPGVSWR